MEETLLTRAHIVPVLGLVRPRCVLGRNFIIISPRDANY